MEKKTWILIIVIILFGIVGGIILNKNDENIDKNINYNFENKEELNQEATNLITNIVDDETVNEIKDNINNEEKTNTSTEIFTESPKTADEKAIAIAKKDYGDKQGIKFGIEGMDEKGRYIVTVRNSETTEALAFYFVNVDNSTFTKKEMN